LSDEIERLRTEVEYITNAAARREIEAREENERLRDRKTWLETNFDRLRAGYDERVAEIEGLRHENEVLTNADTALRIDRDAIIRSFDEYRKDNITVVEQLEDEVERLRDYQTEKYDELADELTEARAEVERLRTENGRIMNAFQKSQAENRGEVERLRIEAKTADKDARDEYNRANDNYEGMIEARREVGRWQAKCVVAEKEIRTTQIEVEAWRQMAGNAQGEVERLRAEREEGFIPIPFKQVVMEWKQLKAEVERLQERFDALMKSHFAQTEARVTADNEVERLQTWAAAVLAREKGENHAGTVG
jgi:chromosome segregation ATPase